MPRTPFARGEPAPLPWQMRAAGCAPAFVAIWSTGPDTALDGVFRVSALRRGDDGTWLTFERSAQPFLNSLETAASLRMVREFGVRSEELANAPQADEAWRALDEFLAGAPVITADREGFEAWRDRFGGGSSRAQPVLGLPDLAALLFPGRLSGARERLVTELCGSERERDAPAAVTPGDVRRALAQLVGRFLALENDVIAVAAASWLVAWRALVDSDPTRAASLELALALVELPSAHIAGGAGLFDVPASLVDGRLTAALGSSGAQAPAELARDSIEILEPRWSRDARGWLGTDTVPPRDDEDKPFGERDLALLDDVFQVHLPAIFAERTGGPPVYREGQHQVARSVADTLGKRELLLVHAPTGTGKTLAYLVPAMIWATRHGVRIGISTYTRALQEQAVEHELPRARRALLRACALGNASLPAEPRVTLLKGRNNYVCWRALRAHVPASDDDAEAWLAWSALALFGLTDDSGDLDRMPLRLPFATRAASHGQRELEVLARQVRAYTACCTAKEDRETCAAEVVRARAERSHVVITNHAFALAKQAWFKHVVFDECEHLHEQAHSAWSHTLTLRAIRDALGRVRQDGRSSSRAALDRVERVAMPGSPASELVEQSARLAGDAVAALDDLQRAIDAFKSWRDEQRRTRDPRDEHSLLREFVLHHDASALRAAHAKLREALESLSVGLAGLVELLDSVRMSGRPRLRRALAIARSDLEEVVAALAAWLPLSDGEPRFQPETFYDVEQDLRGNDVLAARVLLPNEFLGRNYYPQLDSAVFLSATTWLRGSFESAQAYLGLDRAAHPHPDEVREPSVVRTFRAPDPFDYSRVIVCVPRDAPGYGVSKEAFLAYVRRFIAHLGERTRGRMLVLLTNADETRKLGDQLASTFRRTRIPFWYQNMPGLAKEELSALFRARVDSILLGVDTFWYGADFPGETLEYLVIVKLPYGVPDRYHHAQCAALGASEQRRRIYLPRALAKFRQGFGRLMRRETDRGCVFVLDARALAPQHKLFLTELPLAGARIAGDDDADGEWLREGARLVTASTEDCVHAALAHMDMLADVRRRGLDTPFDRESGERMAPPPRDLASPDVDAGPSRPPSASRPLRLDPERLEIAPDDLPF